MRPHRARSEDHASKGDTIVGLGPPNQDEEVDKAPSNIGGSLCVTNPSSHGAL